MARAPTSMPLQWISASHVLPVHSRQAQMQRRFQTASSAARAFFRQRALPCAKCAPRDPGAMAVLPHNVPLVRSTSCKVSPRRAPVCPAMRATFRPSLGPRTGPAASLALREATPPVLAPTRVWPALRARPRPCRAHPPRPPVHYVARAPSTVTPAKRFAGRCARGARGGKRRGG